MVEIQTTQIRVRSYELDAFGHVNNAVFLNYLEYAREEFLWQKGLSFAAFKNWQAFPYVVKINIQYKSPAKSGELLEIRGSIPRWTRTSFTMEKEIFNLSTNRLAAKAEVVLAFVNERERPVAIPAEFREKYQLNAAERR
jgi:YbgC/YbaW family acyl-CoA thioester hydrolase